MRGETLLTALQIEINIDISILIKNLLTTKNHCLCCFAAQEISITPPLSPYFRGNVLDQLFNNIRLKTKLDALTFDCR